MNFRKVISGLLLLSFFVLLTPRQLWHDCGHDHKTYSSHGKKIDKDDCFACDYDLGFIESKAQPCYTFGKPIFSSLVPVSENLLRSEHFSLFSHRGPPTHSLS